MSKIKLSSAAAEIKVKSWIRQVVLEKKNTHAVNWLLSMKEEGKTCRAYMMQYI